MDFTDNSKLLICFSISFCSYLLLYQIIIIFKMENRPPSHSGPSLKRPSGFNEVAHILEMFSTQDELLIECVCIVSLWFLRHMCLFLEPIVCVPRALVVGSSGWAALLAQSIMTTGCANKIRRQNNTVSAWITCTMFETNCSGGKMLFQEKKKKQNMPDDENRSCNLWGVEHECTADKEAAHLEKQQ